MLVQSTSAIDLRLGSSICDHRPSSIVYTSVNPDLGREAPETRETSESLRQVPLSDGLPRLWEPPHKTLDISRARQSCAKIMQIGCLLLDFKLICSAR